VTPLCFIDTETTGLSLDDDIWEFAAIRRESDGTQVEHHFFIQHETAKCSQLPESFLADHKARFPVAHGARPDGVLSRDEAAKRIYELTADRPHIVGAVPNFDTERLAILLRDFGLEPKWHYHLIDVEALAVGYLNAIVTSAPIPSIYEHLRTTGRPDLPWRSDDLSRCCGVEPPSDADRHTAMGDARWAMRLYDAITGGTT